MTAARKSKQASAQELTAIVHKEGKWFVSLCPELDIASQGKTADEARKNLQEAVELFFEEASPSEIRRSLHSETEISRFSVAST
jgi:predicted RNase H-like HicB family nuclease